MNFKEKRERAASALMVNFRKIFQNNNLHPWVAYKMGVVDGSNWTLEQLDFLVEALEWYAKGRPFRDDLGNETELASDALAKLKEMRDA